MTQPSTSDIPAPPGCQADPRRIRDWLNSPCGIAGHQSQTVAEYEGYDTFDQDRGDDLNNLVAHAQRAGVFGIAGHEILAWYINDEDPDLDGFLVTVDTPTGHRLCSSWLPYYTVIPSDLSGVDAVVRTLTDLTASVDEALTGRPGRHDQTHAVAAPAPNDQPLPARAFPYPSAAASLTPPASAPPVGPHTTSHAARPHR